MPNFKDDNDRKIEAVTVEQHVLDNPSHTATVAVVEITSDYYVMRMTCLTRACNWWDETGVRTSDEPLPYEIDLAYDAKYWKPEGMDKDIIEFVGEAGKLTGSGMGMGLRDMQFEFATENEANEMVVKLLARFVNLFEYCGVTH
jgi:hypothetical protein